MAPPCDVRTAGTIMRKTPGFALNAEPLWGAHAFPAKRRWNRLTGSVRAAAQCFLGPIDCRNPYALKLQWTSTKANDERSPFYSAI
jgi:hypothetical protein